jgi:hypothetical protein
VPTEIVIGTVPLASQFYEDMVTSPVSANLPPNHGKHQKFFLSILFDAIIGNKNKKSDNKKT